VQRTIQFTICHNARVRSDKYRTMTRRIRFSLSGSNFITAMTFKERVRKRLYTLGVEYEELSDLPFDIVVSERAYLLFCLQWDLDVCAWKELDFQKGSTP